MSTINQPDQQFQTLRLYGELLSRRDNWAGQLVVAAFEGSASSGVAAASSLAGAASLTVDSDVAKMKLHYRDGAYDFVVNTLDEALRALKNEIRKSRAIAIGLTASPKAALTEAVERGLSARMVFTNSTDPSAPEAELITPNGFVLPLDKSPSSELTNWLDEKGWKPTLLEYSPAAEELEPGDPRRRWSQNLTIHQRSAAKSQWWFWQLKT